MAGPSIADLASEYELAEDITLPAAQPQAAPGKVATPATPATPAAAAVAEPPASAMSSVFPHLPQSMVDAARKWGIAEDVIADAEPTALREAIADARADARAAQRAADAARGPVVGQNGQQQQERAPNGQFMKPNGQPDIAAIQTAEANGLENIGFKLDWGKRADGTEVLESDYDEPLIRVIKTLAARVEKAEKAAAVVQQLQAAEQQRQQVSGRVWLDQQFAAMPAEVKAFIGEGQHGKITKEQHTRRMAIINLAKATPGDDLGVKLSQAATMLFGGSVPPAAANGKLPHGTAAAGRGPTADEWNSSGLAVPTQRNGAPEAPSDQKAVNGLAERMRGMGFDPELSPNGSETSLDGFPE